MTALDRRLATATRIAERAGALALARRPPPGAPMADLKGAQDWVTAADREVEAFLATHLGEAFPEDGFQGEETGVGREGALRWVVDPIDGTSNFARGGARWCVSVGLLDGLEPVLGVIVAPALGETLAALANDPHATLNGVPVRAADTASLGRATVECGWSPRLPNDGYYTLTRRVMDGGAMMRAGGSGALGLADVACGRLDGYVERHINLWDVAAALAIARAGGAVVSDFMAGPGPRRGAPVMAAAPGIANELARLIDFTNLSSNPNDATVS